MSVSLVSHHDEDDVVEDCDNSVPGGSKDHKCPWCPKIYMARSDLTKHIGNYHSTHADIHESKKKEGSGRLECPIKGCNATLASYDALCRHCEDDHGFEPHFANSRFDSEEEFREWLDEWCNTSGRMVKRRGTRRTTDGAIMGDFHCIFDGKKRDCPSTRAPEKTPYNRRVLSKKLGFACPAFIRFQIQNDRSVIIKGQLHHFGHDIQPSNHVHPIGKISRPGSQIIERRKRRGYGLDGQNYDEILSQHGTLHSTNGDEIELDEEGMVNLFTLPPLEQARFEAQRTCTSMDLAFQEVRSIPPENVHHLGHLIDKFHEISAAASAIESLLKQLAVSPSHPPYHTRADDITTKRKLMEARRQSIRKRPLLVEAKEEEKQLEVHGSNEEDSFMQQLRHGELVYHDDSVAEEVVVDDEVDYVEERRERKEKTNKRIDKRI